MAMASSSNTVLRVATLMILLASSSCFQVSQFGALLRTDAAPSLPARLYGVQSCRMSDNNEDSKPSAGKFTFPSHISRRATGALIAGAAWQISSLPSSALKWDTVEKIVNDPTKAAVAFDQERVSNIVRRWKKANVAVSNPGAANAASYTVAYDEFVTAVQKAGKVKIGDRIVENPSEAEMLQAWKTEELRRALEREEKGEEPLTRPVRIANKDKTDIFYLPPVVTKDSSEQALALGEHLKKVGATMYGAFWCSHCYGQKQALGREATEKFLAYVECDRKGAYNKRDLCKEKKVPGFPTWEINGELFPGEKSLEELAKISGFKLQ